MKFLDVVTLYGNACCTLGKLSAMKDDPACSDYIDEIDRLIIDTEKLKAGFEENVMFFYDMACKGFSM